MTSKPKYPVRTINDIDLLNDRCIDMETITRFTGMSDKWFYKLISLDQFPKPIKFGRSSRWLEWEVKQWMLERIEASRN
ncbi:AlpA family phage regulatory protein [Scandinavium goeteborgense]|uniref:helix-turn-helix transcriptional regulator n=1 Tax=Scandinavium goeteborgense TaxID=1851514 RepID=UPI0021669653|nr:AlpA family phage regulatory protein [Scandinavium goeteborgense]MCS2152189.1 AlpA family phage regulatory protein [Scandinavium goeteborgense]